MKEVRNELLASGKYSSVELNAPIEQPPNANRQAPKQIGSARSMTGNIDHRFSNPSEEKTNDPYSGMQEHLFTPNDNYPGVQDVFPAYDPSLIEYTPRVAVLDSGFGYHEDIMYSGGYSFVRGKGNEGSWISQEFGSPNYCSSHGTAVAGLINAKTNNGLGIAGISNAEIIAVEVMHCGAGYLYDVAKGIYYAAGITFNGEPGLEDPVDIINMSLGGESSCGGYMQEAINAAIAKDILIVVAAGNDNKNVQNYSPANCDGVITVGANAINGSKSTFSNFGDLVDISALGTDVVTLAINDNADKSSYAYWSGTSFSAPIVSGIAAMIKQYNPKFSNLEVGELIIQYATGFGNNATGEMKCTSQCGAGVANANTLIQDLKKFSGVNVSAALVLEDYRRKSKDYQYFFGGKIDFCRMAEVKIKSGVLLEGESVQFYTYPKSQSPSDINTSKVSYPGEGNFIIDISSDAFVLNNGLAYNVCTGNDQDGYSCPSNEYSVIDLPQSNCGA